MDRVIHEFEEPHHLIVAMDSIDMYMDMLQ